jgi:hypothetical protein
VTDALNPSDKATGPHGPPLRALGDALSGFILFAGTASAACEAEFACGLAAVLCGAAALASTRLYVAAIWAAQLDDRRKPARIPPWAVVLYAAVGLGLLVLIAHEAGAFSSGSIAFLVGWAAGCNRLGDLWARRVSPQAPQAADVMQAWFAARAAPHWPLLARLGTALSFALLFGATAWHAHLYGFSLAAAARCGACVGPGASSATLAGIAAVLFVVLYAIVAEAAQYAFVDSWKHVRPGPPPPDVPTWVVALHLLIGLVVFFSIGAFVEISPAKPTLGNTWLSVDKPDGRVLTLSGNALFRMLAGWWIGGFAVLKFVWLWRRAAR